MISIYIPCYNGAKTIQSTIARIPTNFYPHIHSIWILNDGSLDQSKLVIDELAKQYPFVHAVHYELNRGYGAMIQEAWLLQKQLIVQNPLLGSICLHADGQYAPEMLPEFYQQLTLGYDVIQGSRHKNKTARSGGMPFYKWFFGHILCWLENWVFALNLSDYHSGYLAFSAKLIQNLQIQNLSQSFDIDLELIASAHTARYSIVEIAIPTRYADEVSYLNPITYGFRVLKVLWKFKQGVYRKCLQPLP